MTLKPLHITILALLLPLAACNAKSNSTVASTPIESAGKPIPQAEGYSNIDNALLKELLAKGVTLIDIRLEEEWKQTGVIKGAKTITFFERTGQINPNFISEFTTITKPDQPVVLICRTGNRTKSASQAIAQQLGYKKVLNVTHGIMGWIAEKRPVEKYQK